MHDARQKTGSKRSFDAATNPPYTGGGSVGGSVGGGKRRGVSAADRRPRRRSVARH